MRRVAALLSVLALLLLLPISAAMAGGGSAPPPFGVMIVNPALSATILMDPHNPTVTPTAGQVSISIRQGTIITQTSFQIPSTLAQFFPLNLGCIADNSGRFLFSSANGAHLSQWIPAFLLESLFVPFGITLDVTALPFITPTPVITQPMHGALTVGPTT